MLSPYRDWKLHIQWWQTAPAAVKNLNISFKCCSKYKSRDSFEICLSWGFQNTPNMLKLIEFWLRYLRSKTNDMILKNSSKLIKIDKNLMKSIHFVSKVINSTFKTLLGTSMSIRIIFMKPMRCFECWINYFWDKMYRLYEIFVYFYQFTGTF